MHRRHRQRSIDTQAKSSMKNPFLSMRDRKYFLWWKRRSRSWMKVAYKQEKITSTSFFFLPNFNLPRPKAESMINDWKSAVLWKERRQEHKKVETLIQRLVSGSPRACYEDKRETTHQLILYLQRPLYILSISSSSSSLRLRCRETRLWYWRQWPIDAVYTIQLTSVHQQAYTSFYLTSWGKTTSIEIFFPHS